MAILRPYSRAETVWSTRFNGSATQYTYGAALPEAFRGDVPMTYMALCFPLAPTTSAYGYLVARTPSGNTQGARMAISHNGGAPRLFFGASSATVPVSPQAESADNSVVYGEWNHVAATWTGTVDPTGINLYTSVNNSPLAPSARSTTTTGSGPIQAGLSSILVVGGCDNFPRQYNGLLAWLARWNRVLSLPELELARKVGPLAVPGCVFCRANDTDYGPYELGGGAPTSGMPRAIAPPFFAPVLSGPRVMLPTPPSVSGEQYQYLRPNATVSSGGWTAVGAATLAQALDEASADNTDYIQSGADPNGDAVELKLSAGTQPPNPNNALVSYTAGVSDASRSLTVTLLCGTTQIAQWVHPAGTLSSLGGSVDQALTSAQVNAITDWTDLRFRFTAS